MYDNKRSVMGKWKRVLIAAALTAGMIMALPGWSVGSAQADVTGNDPKPGVTGTLDLNVKSTLTIQRAAADPAAQGDLVVDLYKVADAELITGYDAYTLKLKNGSPYNTESVAKSLAGALETKEDENGNLIINPVNKNGVNEAYRNLAQDVAKIALKTETKKDEDGKVISNTLVNGKADYTIKFSETKSFSGILAGMYLVVPHGVNLSPMEYIAYIDAKTGELKAPGYDVAGDQNQIVTKSFADGYTYTYLPELISLPMRAVTGTDGTAMAPTGSFNTSDTNPWQYNLTITLKSEQAAQMVSVTINKNFEDSEKNLIGTTGKAVFAIEAKIGNNIVYSNVVEIEDADGLNKQILKDVIPYDEKLVVTITEVYSGAGLEAVGDTTKEIKGPKIKEDGYQITADFTNKYNGNGSGGDIVTNSFEFGENGWEWTPYKDGKEVTNDQSTGEITGGDQSETETPAE